MKRVKAYKPLLLGLNFTCVALLSQAQGFLNLDFESATIIPVSGYPYDVVEFAPAFPGWTGYVGTNQQTLALHNQFFLGSAGLGIMEEPGTGFGFIPPFDGNYMAVLQATVFGGPSGTNRVPATIAQTGSIPVNVNSLQFKGSHVASQQPFEVTLSGQTISMMPLSSTGTYTLYGGDISAFRGQTHEMRITALPGAFTFSVDSIEFSLDIVPEPSAIGLLALGSLLLVGKRRR